MIRHAITARPDHRTTLANEGMLWAQDPETGVVYWRDDAAYSFTPEEIDTLEAATDELWGMCLAAARHMLTTVPDARLGLADGTTRRLLTSLDAGDLGSHARFDLCLTPDGTPKMLEINGDTPTMLIESAIAQWTWHEQVKPETDQWNSIHERLVGAWRHRVEAGQDEIHFAGLLDLEEEASTISYLADTASQAGATTSVFDLRDMGFDVDNRRFVDGTGHAIETCYALYPWEDMLAEPFGLQIESSGVRWLEPLWRQALSTKALLASLWECYPEHPLLVPAYLGSPRHLREYVAKPLFGREGAAIQVQAEGQSWTHAGSHDGEGYVYQAWCPLPSFDGNRPVIGAWVVDGHAAGMGIRETDGPITDADARFVPHYIDAPAPTKAERAQWLAEDGVAGVLPG